MILHIDGGDKYFKLLSAPTNTYISNSYSNFDEQIN